MVRILVLVYLIIYPIVCYIYRQSHIGGGEVILYYISLTVITYILFWDKISLKRKKERILLDDIKLVNDYRNLPPERKDWESAEWLVNKSIKTQEVSSELIHFFSEAFNINQEEFKCTYCVIEKYERSKF